jgi:gliding motility-associated-like protein
MRIPEKAFRLGLYTAFISFACFSYNFIFSQACNGPAVRPTISVSTPSTYVCSGKLVTFVAQATNCGTKPTYQWKINNVNAGINSDTFKTSSLKNGDAVNCMLTVDPGFTCASPKTVSSYGIIVTVAASSPSSITISASSNDICPGTSITFNSITESTSSFLAFQWKLNEMDVGSGPAYSTNTLENGDEVYCVLVDSGGCSTDPVASNKIQIAVKSLPLIFVSPSDTTVAVGSSVKLNALVSGNLSSYNWQPSSGLSNAASLSPVTEPVLSSINYFFNAETIDGCSFSKTISIKVFHAIIMSNAFTPNGDGHNDVFRIPANTNLKLQEFSIFNRSGKMVFSTSDISKGWDGNLNGTRQDPGVYVYIIIGSTSTGKIISKGSFVLVR